MAFLTVTTQVGTREDLADYIAIVDAKSTPLVAMAPKGKELGNTKFEWLADDYAAAQGTSAAQVDGADITLANLTNPVANRVRLANYVQVFQKDLRVGFIHAATDDVAGVTDEIANGIAKRLIEIKRDMEAAFCSTDVAAQADNGTLPYLTSGLGKWTDGTAQAAGTVGRSIGTAKTPAAARDTTASASLAENNIQDVLTGIYNNTGVFRDYDLICGTTLKRAFTNLTNPTNVSAFIASHATNNLAAMQIRTFNKELASDTFKSSIDMFEGDFGRLILHPTTFIGTTTTSFTAQAYRGYVLPMEDVEIRYSKLPEVNVLPDLGGGPARLVRAIAGLVCKNPSALGVFFALS